ncbi:uncharacterized protein LOC136038901 [Artemia franciscana]|uniref:Uncharacterized protein n=1 Tax=Artemia franciscana TaxID=6661 RepID=A0AA88I037_ARTSF|nr:hypothetical protein QYM36_006287 [Artemia franciscana]
MKLILVATCIIGISLAFENPEYRVNLDAPVSASPEKLTEGNEGTYSIITIDSKGRLLKEEPLTEDELKQIEAQLVQQRKPESSEGRNPAVLKQQFQPVNQQQLQQFTQQYQQTPNFIPYPFYRSALPAQTRPTVYVIPEFNETPSYKTRGYQTPGYRAQPIFVIDQSAFSSGYDYPSYYPESFSGFDPNQNARKFLPFVPYVGKYPTYEQVGHTSAVEYKPNGGNSGCLLNILTGSKSCFAVGK